MIKYVAKDLIEVAKEGKNVAVAITADGSIGRLAKRINDEAVEFVSKFVTKFPCGMSVGRICKFDNVYLLADKSGRYSDIIYDDFLDCIESLDSVLYSVGENEIYIPMLGCGADGLVWDDIVDDIENCLSDVTVYVCVKADSPYLDDENEDDVTANTLVLERADLILDDGYGNIVVDKQIFDSYEENGIVNISFVEDSTNDVFEYRMICETNDGIVMRKED